MTTIAFRDGFMAADTASWDANRIFFGRITKLHRLPDGRLMGVAGSASMVYRVVDWLTGQTDKPEVDRESRNDAFNALIAGNGTLFYLDNTLTFMPHDYGEFTAIGTGRELALGAMAMGATAQEAVLVACEYDAVSRKPVTVIKV